jgi:exopolysaccharide production protein ExoQ
MPQLVLLAYCCLVCWLYRKDTQIRQLSSRALWIPALLLTIIGTKPISMWLSQLGFAYSRLDRGEVDQTAHTLMVLAALGVLAARRFQWTRFLFSNKALVLMYLFWFASCVWAPDGFSAFKRVFRDVGCVVIGMVFLTERDPWNAIRTVFVRISYLILPLSIVLAKFFPELGRSHTRGGDTMYTGVASHKNTMGVIALTFGLLLFADLLSLRKREARQIDLRIRYALLANCVWIILMVDSKTSLLCLCLGCLLFWVTGRLSTLENPAQVLARVLPAVLVIAALEATFGISSFVIEDLLGRDVTLTGRTEIWAAVKAAGTDPWLGVGFFSFWDTPAARIVDARFPGGLVTAHNGFLETYLDGGIVGVTFLVMLLATWLFSGIRGTLARTIRGQLTLVVWIIAMIYNNSETSFFRVEPLWFALLLLTNQYQHAFASQTIVERQPRRSPQRMGYRLPPLIRPARRAVIRSVDAKS